ncbi:unnamed protein product, partial [Ectocarpus sp. 4 AP-2014]
INVTPRVGHELGDRLVAVAQLADVHSGQRSFAQSLEDGWKVYVVVVEDADELQVAAGVRRRLQNTTDALPADVAVANSQPSQCSARHHGHQRANASVANLGGGDVEPPD